MNKLKYVFFQFVAFMDSDKFRHIVDKANTIGHVAQRLAPHAAW